MTLTITQCLNTYDCCYLALVDKSGDVLVSQIQESGNWVGGDEGGWTNDSNVRFETPQEVESYYRRRYRKIYVFADEFYADEMADELEANQ